MIFLDFLARAICQTWAINAKEIYHQNRTVKIAFNVDERGFCENWDVGRSWGLDDMYVKLIGAQ